MQPLSAILLTLWLFLGAGILAVEFQVEFLNKPVSLRYNRFYGKNELTLELKLTEVAPLDVNNKRIVTGLSVTVDKGISSKNFGATVLARLLNSGTRGQLIFLCSSWFRCAEIKQHIDESPSYIHQAVEIAPFGLQGGLPVQFGSVRPSGHPAVSDFVFQQHLDNSLSFAQNWNAYVRGFGDPRGNYWMGLHRLSALTKDRNCKWTVEVEFFNGSVLSATYKDFQVRGADENYRLRVGAKESGRLNIYDLPYHNNRQFSTFDRDNDDSSHNCSKDRGGSSGWWFGDCYEFILNGRIISESDWSTKCIKHTGLSDIWDGQNYACPKRSQLSFRCR